MIVKKAFLLFAEMLFYGIPLSTLLKLHSHRTIFEEEDPLFSALYVMFFVQNNWLYHHYL